MTRSRRRKIAREQAIEQRRRPRSRIPVASALLAAMPAAYAQNAPAQAPAETSGGLQEIVVTAEKRVENLQNVPISVTVFDSAKLEQLGVVNLDDYVKYTPSLSYVRGQGEGSNGQPGDSHIYIRGVVSGGDGNHSGSQPSVGVYLDEQPVTTIDGTPDMHVYDVQRIEVLEGPQGTLFGASSESGTVRIITNKPDPTHFAAGYDLQGNQVTDGGAGWEAEGFVNIPITANAAVRLVGWAEHDAGYISNVAGSNPSACIQNGVRTFPSWAGQPAGSYVLSTGAGTVAPCPTVAPVGAGSISNAGSVAANYNTVDIHGGRAALKINLGDNWSVTPALMAQNTSTEGFFAYDPGVGDLQVVHFGPEIGTDNWYQAALTVEGKVNNFDIVYAGGYFKRDGHTIGEYSDYSLFYDKVYGSGAFWVGNNGNPVMPQQFVDGAGYFEKWSHELRVSTPDNLPVKATVGLFIQRQLHDIWQLYTMPGYGYSNVYTGNPNGLATALSIPGFPDAIWLTDEQRVDRDQAAFAQVTWDINSQWALTGGLRYYKYDNGLQGFYGYSANYSGSTGQSQCFAPALNAGLTGGPCTDLNTEVSDTGTVPRVNLTYKITPEAMVYATYSKGFRPGGVNRVSEAGFPPYKADYLTNYEVGWKVQSSDHRVRWNGALFWEDWKDFQFSFLVPPSITAIANGGNARIKGLENELDFVPSDHLFVSTNLTLLDPVLTQNYCGGAVPAGVTSCPGVTAYSPFLPGGQWVGPLAPAGTNLPVVPKFKGNIVARYTFGATSNVSPYAQAAYVYQSKTSPQLQADIDQIIGMMPAYGILDLAAGAAIDNFNIELYCANAGDKRAQLSRFSNTNPLADNQVYILPATPRTIGIKFSQRF
jgi:iron complex outermembrane recepter protein